MSMLKIIEITLKIETNNIQFVTLNHVMNDYLCNLLDDEYKLYLDKQILKPYTQYILKKETDVVTDNLYTWRISSLNSEATEKIIYVLMQQLERNTIINFSVKKNFIRAIVMEKNYIHSVTYKQLLDKYFATNRFFKQVEYQFITPWIGNSSQEIKLPQAKDILANLIANWNLFAKEYTLYEENLVANLTENMVLIDYDLNLKPSIYANQSIPTFTGRCSFRLANNIMSKKIIGLLTEYANYTGLGMNTYLGYGAMNTKIHRK